MGQNRTLKAKHLVVTFPVPQVIELLDRSDLTLDPLTMDRLRAVRYTRCIALLGLLSGSSNLDHPGTVTHPVAEVDWVSDNQVKGSRKNPPVRFTRPTTFPKSTGILRTKNEVRCLRKSPRKLWQPRLRNGVVIGGVFHKPLQTFGASHFHSAELALTLAGDGFGGKGLKTLFCLVGRQLEKSGFGLIKT